MLRLLVAFILPAAPWACTVPPAWEVETCTNGSFIVNAPMIYNGPHYHVSEEDFQIIAGNIAPSTKVLDMSLRGHYYPPRTVSEAGLFVLGRSFPPNLTSLRLDLSLTKVTDAGLSAVCRKLPQKLTSLHLDLMLTEVTDVGLSALAGKLPQKLTSLHLDLSSTKVTDVGLSALAGKLPPNLTSLHLDLYHVSGLTDVGLTTLAGKLPPSLTHLFLDLLGDRYDQGHVTDVGLSALSRKLPPKLTNLHLDLAYTQVANVGVSALSRSLPFDLQNLELNLQETKVTGHGLVGLVNRTTICMKFTSCVKFADAVVENWNGSACRLKEEGLRTWLWSDDLLEDQQEMRHALFKATRDENWVFAACLLAGGADVLAKNDAWRTPYDEAELNHQQEMMEFLALHNGNPNQIGLFELMFTRNKWNLLGVVAAGVAACIGAAILHKAVRNTAERDGAAAE